MKTYNSKYSVMGLTTLMTQLFYFASLFGNAAADKAPHSNWDATAFRLADDTNPYPSSAFILALDPKVFKNVTAASNAILEKCTNLASTAVNSWDDQSIDFTTLKDYPGGIWKTEASAYQTFANNQFGTVPSGKTLDCIGDALNPFYDKTFFIDWDWSTIGTIAGITLFACCICMLMGCVTPRCSSSTKDGENERLFSPGSNDNHYGTSIQISEEKSEVLEV